MTGLTTATNLTLKVLNKRRYPAISQTRNNFFKKLFGKKKSSEYDSNLTPCSRIETRGMSMPMIGIGTWQVSCFFFFFLLNNILNPEVI